MSARQYVRAGRLGKIHLVSKEERSLQAVDFVSPLNGEMCSSVA